MKTSTSLSQGIGKRSNGNSLPRASIADIKARSTYRSKTVLGSQYSFVRSHNQLKIQFSQCGDRHDRTRAAYVGEFTRASFISYGAITLDGEVFSWNEIADLIGCHPETLLRSALKFSQRFQPEVAKSGRDRQSGRATNRKKQSQADRLMKGVRIA